MAVLIAALGLSLITLSPADIIKTTMATLQHFDNAAAVQYQAYHKV